jgi:hypothetical protein
MTIKELLTNPTFWQVVVASAALIVSGASFALAWSSNRRIKKAEQIKNLLGEKETVAYAALKILRDGLPNSLSDRRLLIDALLQACVFEGSDRARAILYRVLEEHREAHRDLIGRALEKIESTFTNMDVYQFNKNELDLSRGKLRLDAVKRVVKGGSKGQAASARIIAN